MSSARRYIVISRSAEPRYKSKAGAALKYTFRPFIRSALRSRQDKSDLSTNYRRLRQSEQCIMKKERDGKK